MRALVTGAAGFIGRELVRQLMDAGWHVTGVDNLEGPGEWPAQLDPNDRVTCADWDLRALSYGDRGKLDAVFALASPVGPIGVLEKAGRIVPEIIRGAVATHRWAVESGCPLVYISTSELYGEQGGIAASEMTPCVFQPGHTARQEYALGKRAAESTLLGLGGDVRIIRPFNIAGPHQRPAGGFVIPRWIEQAKAGDPLTVYQPGTQRRAFCHVTDFVEGTLAVLRGGASGEAYNIGNPANGCSISSLAGVFAEEWGDRYGYRPDVCLVDPRTLHGPEFAEAPDKLPIIGKAVECLGWRPIRVTRQIIRDAIEAAT